MRASTPSLIVHTTAPSSPRNLSPAHTFPHLSHTCRPAPKYLPWFRTVLKAAKVAVHILGLLSAEARASRLSFADVVKRLAELAEGDSAFISKKV